MLHILYSSATRRRHIHIYIIQLNKEKKQKGQHKTLRATMVHSVMLDNMSNTQSMCCKHNEPLF